MESEKPMDATTDKKGKGHITISLIGEKGCGKTALVLAANNLIFPHPDERIAAKKFIVDVEVDGKTEECLVLEGDIYLGDEPDLRSKMFSETDVVVLCFTQTGSMALRNVKKWYKKLHSKLPVLIVRIIKTPTEDRMVTIYGDDNFPRFYTCFPHQMEGVKDVFQRAVEMAQSREK